MIFSKSTEQNSGSFIEKGNGLKAGKQIRIASFSNLLSLSSKSMKNTPERGSSNSNSHTNPPFCQ